MDFTGISFSVPRPSIVTQQPRFSRRPSGGFPLSPSPHSLHTRKRKNKKKRQKKDTFGVCEIKYIYPAAFSLTGLWQLLGFSAFRTPPILSPNDTSSHQSAGNCRQGGAPQSPFPQDTFGLARPASSPGADPNSTFIIFGGAVFLVFESTSLSFPHPCGRAGQPVGPGASGVALSWYFYPSAHGSGRFAHAADDMVLCHLLAQTVAASLVGLSLSSL